MRSTSREIEQLRLAFNHEPNLGTGMKRIIIPCCCLAFAFLSVGPAVADKEKTRLCEIVLERLIYENHLAQALLRHNLGLMGVSMETGIPQDILVSDEIRGYLDQFLEHADQLESEWGGLCKE